MDLFGLAGKVFESTSQGEGKNYVLLAQEARRARDRVIAQLLNHRKMPESGWDSFTIEHFLRELSLMDSNNFTENVGVGEREGRVFSSLVRQKNLSFAHGIGRSGDINAIQPKAAGSSLMLVLTNSMALHALRISGVVLPTRSNQSWPKPMNSRLSTPSASACASSDEEQRSDSESPSRSSSSLSLSASPSPIVSSSTPRKLSCMVLPLATGMAIAMTLMTLRAQRPGARYVIWPRIDQKTCLKCIFTAGLEPIVIESLLVGDEARTDLKAIENAIDEKGADAIVCVLSTTSCFAPRAPDNVEEIAKLCGRRGIGHVINNAYGVQSSKIAHMLTQALRSPEQRVDAFIQSTDKNFMVPVGGAIVASPHSEFLADVSRLYPGRASSAPVVDLFVTLLEMGVNGYTSLLQERKRNFEYCKEQLQKLASRHGERLLHTPSNPISLAMSLSTFDSPSRLGSMLFTRCVSGTRVVDPTSRKQVCGINFNSYGAHHDGYPVAYLNAACAIGQSKAEIEVFIKRLDKTIQYFKAHTPTPPSTSTPLPLPLSLSSPSSPLKPPPSTSPSPTTSEPSEASD